MKPTVFLMMLLCASAVCQAADKTCKPPEPTTDPKFHAGQIWKYRARPGDDQSFITILRVEKVAGFGTILHVRVDKIRLQNCTGGPEPETIEHMPFARDAVDRSVTKLEKESSEIPDYRQGYDEWRRSCGGVYAITVAEAVAVDQATFSKKLGCTTKP
jgi:hypothetical protein